MNSSDFNFELFFDLSADLFCIAGFDGYFKKINTSVVQTLGFTQEELFSSPINKFVHPEDQHLTNQVRNQIHKSNPLLNFENRYLTKSGETVWLSWTSMPVEDQQLVFAIAKNITQKKKLEADRNLLLAQLTQVNQDLQRFLYMTSHDLRAPVNNLISAFRLLDTSKISDPETLELVEILEKSSQKLKNTLNSYVDDLAESHRSKESIKEVSFSDSLNKVLESIPHLIQDSSAKINSDFSLVESLYYNPTYLESILLNLVTNSIKYARPGHPPEISIYTLKEAGKVKMQVRDNGIGIDLEKVGNRLFGFQEKFHEIPDSKGIGLYLVYHHVTKMGGKIEVSSVLHSGTTFTITF